MSTVYAGEEHKCESMNTEDCSCVHWNHVVLELSQADPSKSLILNAASGGCLCWQLALATSTASAATRSSTAPTAAACWHSSWNAVRRIRARFTNLLISVWGNIGKSVSGAKSCLLLLANKILVRSHQISKKSVSGASNLIGGWTLARLPSFGSSSRNTSSNVLPVCS